MHPPYYSLCIFYAVLSVLSILVFNLIHFVIKLFVDYIVYDANKTNKVHLATKKLVQNKIKDRFLAIV